MPAHALPHPRKTNVLIWLALALMFSAMSLKAIDFHPNLLKIVGNHYDDAAVKRLVAWQALSRRTELTEKQKLIAVNRFFNRAKFVSDIKQWGEEDYWATPVELLSANAGDCEDYSIAKYFTLVSMGVSEEKLQVSYVKSLTLDQAHMVLAYYPTPESTPFILDNLIPQIKSAAERDDLVPFYSFNVRGLWLSKFKKQSAKHIGDPEQIDSWKALLKRQNKMLIQATPAKK